MEQCPHLEDGRLNCCGKQIRYYRTQGLKISRNKLAYLMRQRGVPLGEKSLYRIEEGTRRISDLELIVFANVLRVPIQELFIGPQESQEVPQDPDKKTPAGEETAGNS